MNFPSKFMKLSDLVRLGFPRETLNRIYNERGQRIAFKMNPEKKNSHIIFDTDALEEKLVRETKIERSMRI